MALGARHPDILRLVMGQGTRLIAMGVLCGMPLAIGATRLLSAMLFGLTPNDATTFGQVGLIITVTALIACAVPAFRAMRLASVPLRGE